MWFMGEMELSENAMYPDLVNFDIGGLAYYIQCTTTRLGHYNSLGQDSAGFNSGPIP